MRHVDCVAAYGVLAAEDSGRCRSALSTVRLIRWSSRGQRMGLIRRGLARHTSASSPPRALRRLSMRCKAGLLATTRWRPRSSARATSPLCHAEVVSCKILHRTLRWLTGSDRGLSHSGGPFTAARNLTVCPMGSASLVRRTPRRHRYGILRDSRRTHNRFLGASF